MLQSRVVLKEPEHRYFDTETGNELVSWSRFIELFSEKFDADKWSKKIAERDGKSQKAVLAEWDKKRDDSIDHGKRIHKALEDYATTYSVAPENADLEMMVKSVFTDYREYNKMYDEVALFTRHGVAGTADKVLQLTSHAKSVLDIEDFKTNLSKGIVLSNKYNQYFKYPIEHLSDCNFNKYALQLSFYAFCAEEVTGRRIRSLWLRYIPAQDKLQHIRMPIPYLKSEIRMLMAEFERMKLDGRFIIENKQLNSAELSLNETEEPTF